MTTLSQDPEEDGSQDATDVSTGEEMQIDTVNVRLVRPVSAWSWHCLLIIEVSTLLSLQELPSNQAEGEHEDIDAELQALLEVNVDRSYRLLSTV